MYAGQIIAYTIQPIWNISIEWVSEITHLHEPYYFVDEQRFGPYKLWHHEHRFNSLPKGVEIIDKIYYKMPFGFLGKALHYFKVKQDLEAIFSYRHLKLESLFGTYSEEI
jgi:ligand-binding SRPBCC domain-containing protein